MLYPVLLDIVFCALVLVFIRADQALLAARLRARGEVSFRQVRAFPFVILGALVGIFVVPAYLYASRGTRKSLALGLGVVALFSVFGWLSGHWIEA